MVHIEGAQTFGFSRTGPNTLHPGLSDKFGVQTCFIPPRTLRWESSLNSRDRALVQLTLSSIRGFSSKD